jgi:MFS family permease
MFSAIFVFLLGDRFGRRPNNIAGAIIVAIGATIQSTTFTLPQFLVGRLVAGFGLGIMTTIIPIWLTECAMPKSRGRMMAMQLSNLIMGLIIANWLDYGMSSYSGSIQWRFPCAFQVVFYIIVCCMAPFMPESPRYLCATDQIEKAAISLAALRGGYPDTPEISRELEEIRYTVTIEARETGSWSDVFRDNGISGSTRVLIAFAANFL